MLEAALYSVNLAIHNLLLVACAASPAAAGTTLQLTLQSTALYDKNAQPISHERINGLFTVR